MLDYDFSGLTQRTVTALFHRQINNNRPRFHGFNHVFRYQHRCRTAGNKRRCDNNILRLDCISNQLGLFGFIAITHFFGIAT